MSLKVIVGLIALSFVSPVAAQYNPEMWLPAASKVTPKISINPGILAGTAELTVGECFQLGCKLEYDTSCPFTIHGVLADNTVRCVCGTGANRHSACVNEND